jgi:hypothetical protein
MKVNIYEIIRWKAKETGVASHLCNLLLPPIKSSFIAF